MQFSLWPEVLVNSAWLAGIYVLIAMAWTVIFRSTKVFNFATGEFAILGAYIFYWLTSTEGLDWWLALVLSLGFGLILGAATYQTLLKPLTGRPLWAPVTLTMGVAFIVDAVLELLWGDTTRTLPSPTTVHTYKLGGSAFLTSNDIVTMIIALICYGAVLAGFKWLHTGRLMRAAAESPALAAQGGIRVHRTFAIGWALATSIAVLAGVLYGMDTSLAPTDTAIGVLGLTPALIGGLDSVRGVLIGGIVAALMTNFATLYAGGAALDAVTGVVLLLIIAIRPYGIFGTRNVVRV